MRYDSVRTRAAQDINSHLTKTVFTRLMCPPSKCLTIEGMLTEFSPFAIDKGMKDIFVFIFVGMFLTLLTGLGKEHGKLIHDLTGTEMMSDDNFMGMDRYTHDVACR
jgi:hypothetical protein